MFKRDNWFAWYPVTVRTSEGTRLALFEYVTREYSIVDGYKTSYRYYTYY